MTITPTLPPDDDRNGWHALAIRWPNLPDEVQEGLKEQMGRARWRRLERTVGKLHEDKRTFGQQYCTREDAVKINALFLEQQVMPIAANLDTLEARVRYLELWFFQRWWVKALKTWYRFNRWLASKGVRLVNMEDNDGTPEPDTALDASGDEGSAVHRGAEEVHGPPEGDRLQPGDHVRVEHGGGAADGSGSIRVVSR